MAGWHFLQKRPGDTARNPVTGEYFDEEAIERPAQALVREVIQNSLDARANGGPVRMRFFVSGVSAALSAERAEHWFGDAWKHFKAADSGLRPEQLPAQPSRCLYIVVEDFGTTGLEGDVQAWEGDKKNHFYAFFRAEGVSENTGGRGKWGVGKTVFPRSSRASSLFGLTVRLSDRRQFLMGRAILRFHRVNNSTYVPDGYWGKRVEEFVQPLADARTLAEFRNDFRIRRRDEPGLSVMVPFVHEEITTKAILQAVGREYFYPILAGRLAVAIEGNQDVRNLDADNLLDSMEIDQGDLQGDLRAVVNLGIWALTMPEAEHIRLLQPPPEQPPVWSETLVPDRQITQLARRFAQGEQLAFCVPITVPTPDRQWRASFLKIYMKQDLTGRGYPPVFIREGIIIPKALERRVRGHQLLTLVVIDDKPLAALLADAETPAHTQWSHQTQNFRGKYEHGKAFIDFVRSAPRQLAEILSGARRERDRLTLADFFPRPPEDDGLEIEQASERPSRRTDPTAPPPAPPPPPPPPRPFVIEPLTGGFCLKRGDPSIVCPQRLAIAVGYDRTRGNPIKKYHSADFRLDSMRKKLRGVREVTCRENRMLIDIIDDDFRLEVTGFDENRDVYVKAIAREPSDD